MPKKNRNKIKIQIEKYKCLIAIFQHDGKNAWNTFIAFLIAQSIIFASTGKSFLELEKCESLANKLLFIGTDILGLSTSILLFFIYKRFSKYNEFRIKQLKRDEPDGWEIFKGAGEKFSKGEEVFDVKIPFLYRRAKVIIPILMGLFIFVYIALFFIYLFI